MPTYKNVSKQSIDFVTTGHMEPGEIKSLADEIDHPDLERVDDQLLTTLQATEPSNDQAPVEAQHLDAVPPAAPVTPAPAPASVQSQSAPVQPAAPAPAPQPAPQQNVTPNQGA